MLEQTLDCLVDSGGRDAPVARRASGRARELPGRPAAAQAHSSGSSTSPLRLRSCCSCRETMAWQAPCLAWATTGRRPHSAIWRFDLPEGAPWQLQPGDYDPGIATLGFCLGAYRYSALKPAKRGPARLLAPTGQERSRSAASATWMVRDLINTPANLLGPVELAEFATSLGQHHGAATDIVADDALEHGISRPSPRSAAGRRGRRASPSSAGPAARPTPMRRSFRCAARACASTPAATTSSRRAACCG